MTLRRLDHALVLTDGLEESVGDRPEAPFAGYWL
jgi:hypothetical protein